MMSAASGPLIIAVVGDVHGAHRAMVALVERRARAAGVVPSLVLQVGDFEPNRGEVDRGRRSPEAPLGDFADFVAGRARYPWPVWVIGGNHEPYPWLDALEPGSELAPDCRWLGWSGRRNLGGVGVAWLSGIHAPTRFTGERPRGVSGKDWKLATYFTARDVAELSAGGRADLLLLHDWPSGLVARGGPDPFAGSRVKAWTVGNRHARALIETLRPRVAVCGHMHVGHRAEVRHPDGTGTRVVCLASVAEGDAGCALLRVDADGIREALPADG